MFHDIRRRDRALSEVEAWAILGQAEWGVFSTVGEDGWPYGVPVNHVVLEGLLYFHCAQVGHKLANLDHEARVSYCAISQSEVSPAELSTNYESAVVFGRAETVGDDTEKRRALEALLARFAPHHPAEGAESMRTDFARTTVVRITPDRITGKARRAKA